MTDPAPPLREQYARAICQSRGADPDAPITARSAEGEMVAHEHAWEAYLPLADELLALIPAP